MNRYFRFGSLRLLGAPIYLHWSVLVVTAILLVMSIKEPIMAVISITAYLSIILIHELGHAFLARRHGARVIAIRLGWFHGLCEYVGSGDEWTNVLIAWGGVLANLICGAIAVGLILAWPDREWGYLGPFIVFWGYIGLLLIPISLAPSPLVDGGTAWRILPLYLARRQRRRK